MFQLKKHKSLLTEALGDINKELDKLGRLKNKLERRSKSVRAYIDSTQSQELNLRNELTELIVKEERLSKRKETLQLKINKLKEKIDKVSRVGRDLGSV